MKANTSKTDLRKSPRSNNKVSPTRTSPKNANEKASPTNRKNVASPKASPKGKVGQVNGAAGRGFGTAQGSKGAYNTATAASSVSGKKKGDGEVAKATSPRDKAAASKSWDQSTKVRPGSYSSSTSQTQRTKLRQTTQNQKTQAVARGHGAGQKGAPVTAKSYSKGGAGATASNNKGTIKNSSFQQNVSKKIQGLKDLQIETYDAAKGRPSLMDIDNKQVFEGNYLPASLQHLSEQYTPQLGGAAVLSSTHKSSAGFSSNPAGNSTSLIKSQSPETIVSMPGIAGPAQSANNLQKSDVNCFQQQPFNAASQGMKFKKKSQIEETQLNKILDSRARISINSQTGKHEFKYCQKSTSNLRQSQLEGQGYWQNSDSLVNFINEQNGGQLDQMAPIRPSNLIWQLPYEERKSYINQQCELQFNRMSKMNPNGQLFGASAKGSDANAAGGGSLGVDKQDSVGFVQASGSDSEFEHIDDYIDEAEEFNGASRAVKLSIRALNFNMMLAEKQSEQDPNCQRKVSLLSRASSLVQNANKADGQRNGQVTQKNYDRSSKLLNLYLKKQNSSQGRDSYLMMSGIDERDEFDEYSHSDSVHSNILSRHGGGSKNASSRGSTLKKQYNFPTFFTPSQSSKKIGIDHMQAKHSGTTTGQSKQIKFFTQSGQKNAFSQHHSQRSQLDRSAISEQELEDSQAVDEEVTSSEYATAGQREQYISGKFSQQVSMMQESHQEEPEDPEADIVDDDDNTGNCQAADEGYSDGFYQQDQQDPQYIMGRNSRPSAQLQMASQFSEEVANENEEQTQNTFYKMQPGGIIHQDDQRERDLFQQTQKIKQESVDREQLRRMKQSQSQAVSAMPRSTHENIDEQTEERFVAETGNSQPASFVAQNATGRDGHGAKGNGAEPESHSQSLHVVEQNSSEFNNNVDHVRFQQARLNNAEQKYIDSSVHYYDNDGQQVLESGPTQRSGAIVDKHIQQQPGQNQFVNLESDCLGYTERTDPNLNDSFQNEDPGTKNTDDQAADTGGYGIGSQGSAMTNNQYYQQNMQYMNASQSPMTLQHSGLQSSGYPYADRLKTTERNPLTMSENTTLEKSDINFMGGAAYPNHEVMIEQNHRQQSEDSQNLIACSYEQPQQENHPQQEQSQGNPLNQFVTKVPQVDTSDQQDGQMAQQNLHQQHFVQTVQALQFIQNNIRVVEEHEMQDLVVQLPPPRFPDRQKKLAIFDMDETLIHCVDDIETQDPDIVLEIDFPDEETVYAGINIRPYIMECLEEANKHFQVIAFTASHQVYADAILDYVDPNHEFITHRLYRQHCFLTEEGYYVKDLRIFQGWDLKDVVIIDNSVYSFAFQIDNGIPIIPFYNDKQDEEMMHLVYYLNCLAKADDVREQNRQAFELFKLSNGESLRNSNAAAGVDAEQQYYDDDGEEQDPQYYDSNNMLDITNENQEYMDLQDPSQQPQMLNQMHLNSDIHGSYRQQYQIDDVIHEDCREDFNSYNESAAHRSKKTDDSHLQHISAEQYNRLMAAEQMNNGGSGQNLASGFKGVDGMDALEEYTEQTEDETSPILYNDGSQLDGQQMMHYGQQQALQQQSDFPYTNPSDRLLVGNDTDEALSASQINEENSVILNSHIEAEEALHQQHQYSHQQNQQALHLQQNAYSARQDTGDIGDQDDEGGNFYMGSDGENAPLDY